MGIISLAILVDDTMLQRDFDGGRGLPGNSYKY